MLRDYSTCWQGRQVVHDPSLVISLARRSGSISKGDVLRLFTHLLTLTMCRRFYYICKLSQSIANVLHGRMVALACLCLLFRSSLNNWQGQFSSFHKSSV